jgi:hypothetical protein
MRVFIVSGGLSGLPYVSILPHTTVLLSAKDFEHKMRVLISLQFCTETFLTLRRIQRLSHMYRCLRVKYGLFLSDFIKLEFSRQIKETQIRNFIKTGPVGAEVFHADGRTDRQTDRRTDGRTDIHDEVNCHFSQCFESA